MHLLVVDDDAAVREALALVLGLDGFEVSTAGDGREAMRTLSQGRPDAVIPSFSVTWHESGAAGAPVPLGPPPGPSSEAA